MTQLNSEKESGNEDFKAKIEIEFNENSLIISDNGIGMDDYIFENYFLKVGKSFYKSKDCKALINDYDSISEFGIGILSCFMVAESIEVESKRKPFDNNQPEKPILVEIPTAYGYMIKKKSEKQDIGTTIKLSLKKNHPFEDIPKLIKEIAPYIDYEIKYTGNDSSSILKPDIPNSKEFEDYFDKNIYDLVYEIDFENSENEILRNIRGKAYAFAPKKGFENIYKNSKNSRWHYKISQEGFDISGIDLFPFWNKVNVSIDLRGKAKLNLKPNRTCFVVNEQFQTLKNLIDLEIEKKIANYLAGCKSKYSQDKYNKLTDILFKIDFLDESAVKTKNEIAKLINVNCIKSDGSIGEITLYDLRQFSKIIYIDDLKENYEVKAKKIIDTLKNIISDKNIPIIFNKNKYVCYTRGFISDYKTTAHLITEIPELILRIHEKLSSDENKSVFSLNKNLIFSNNIISKHRESNPLFVFHTYNTPIFNLNHAFFKKFLDKTSFTSKNPLLIKALEPIDKNYNDVKYSYKNDFLRICENLKEFGFIGKDEIMPEIIEKDLPWAGIEEI